jgi:hypothetical protein
MTTVSFIGSTLKYDTTTAWPTSLTLTESDIPAGTQVGDRLVLVVVTFTDGVNVRDIAGFNLGSDWSIVYASAPNAGVTVANEPIIYVYASRYGLPGALNQTVSPRKSDGTAAAAQNSWGFAFCSLRPSRAALTAQAVTVVSGADPSSAISGNVDQYRLDIVAVRYGATLAFLGNGPLPAPSPQYQSRLAPSPVVNRWGGIGIADVTHDSTFSGGTWCSYAQTGTSRRAYVGIDFSASDDPLLGAGWSIGRIAY